MHPEIEKQREALAALCRRYRVARLEVFGSAAREADFDPRRSDFDFVVAFEPEGGTPSLHQYVDFAEALEKLFGRPVDLIERKALDESRNYIRRRAILEDATVVYG